MLLTKMQKFVILIFLIFAQNLFAIENLVIQPVQKTVSRVSIYRIEFTTTEAMAKDAEFVLTFPSDFNLSKVILASSKTINGGFKVTRNNSKVIVSRSGLGDEIPTGKKVEILLGNILNPGSAGNGYNVTIEINNGIGKATQSAATFVEIQEKAFE